MYSNHFTNPKSEVYSLLCQIVGTLGIGDEKIFLVEAPFNFDLKTALKAHKDMRISPNNVARAN